MIEDYMLSKGVNNPHLLERTLGLSIPDGVRENIKRLIRASVY